MNSFFAKQRNGIILFCLCATFAVAAAYPVYRAVSGTLSTALHHIQEETARRSGITLTYRALSPSVLIGLKLKDIVLRDTADGSELLSVSSAVLRYDVLSILRRDWRHLFRTLTIYGVVVDIDTASDSEVIEKLLLLFRRPSSENDAAPVEISPALAFDPDAFVAELPLAIFIRNVVFRVRNENSSVNATLKNASFFSDRGGKNIRVTLNAMVDALLSSDTISLTSALSVDGTLSDGFKNSSLLVRLSRIAGAQVSLGALNLLMTYEDRAIQVRSFQNIMPLSILARYEFDERAFSATAAADNLALLSFISFQNSRSAFARMLSGLSVTGGAHVRYELDSGEIAYESNAQIAFAGGLSAAYTVSGTKASVFIPQFSMTGNRYHAEFSGSYTFASLQLDGTASLRQLGPPHGEALSSEFFFTPRQRGFDCFSPHLFIGEKTLSAFSMSVIPSASSVDFHAEISDYSRQAGEQPGTLAIDGSYLSATRYLETSISAVRFYADSIAHCVALFPAAGTTASSIAERIAPYVVSTDIYVSTDFKTLSYNMPYFLMANTTKENEALLLSLDGNDATVRISYLNLLYRGQSVTVTAQADFTATADGRTVFFSTELTAGTIPYRLTGNLSSGLLIVSGDYGLSFQMHREHDGSWGGTCTADAFPVAVTGALVTISTHADFTYDALYGITASIPRLEFIGTGDKLRFNPRFSLTGSVSPYGIFFDSVVYSDAYSSLSGTLHVVINKTEGIFSSAHVESKLVHPLTAESLSLFADITNPGWEGVTSFRESLYFNGQLTIHKFSTNRFFREISDTNLCSGSIVASGTLDNPFVALTVTELTGVISGTTFSAVGTATVEDRQLSLSDAQFRYGTFSFEHITTAVSLETFDGTATAELHCAVGNGTVTAPVVLSIFDTERERGHRPTAGVVMIASEQVSGSLFTHEFPFSVSFIYGGGTIFVTTSDNIGLSGWIDTSGALSLSIPETYPLSFSIGGVFNREHVNISVHDVNVDAPRVLSALTLKQLAIHSGQVTGGFSIQGLLSDPEFTGELVATAVDFSVPAVVPSHVTTSQMRLTMEHNQFVLPETAAHIKSTPASARAAIVLDRWKLDYISADIRTAAGVYAPVNLRIPYARFEGDAQVDLSLLYQNRVLNITGTIQTQDTNGTIQGGRLATASFSGQEKSPRLPVFVDLHIVFGEHTSLFFDPVLRSVFVPGSAIDLRVDQSTQTYSVTGDVRIRSGEITYVGRNFYLRSGGTLRFTDMSNQINPLITLEAETRERDENGRDVRIIMGVANQYLLDLSPRFSSIPAKSETEIRTLLGQIATGDSASIGDIFATASDWALQATVGRYFENRLRQLLHFDIFSVRTMVLQNVLRQGLNGENMRDTNIGNYLDNSTVYIGKYFGSVLYADALLHLSYDKGRIDDATTLQGMVFRPEIGLEFDSPLANIRWSTAPNINALMNDMYVPSTSLTLSWRFSF